MSSRDLVMAAGGVSANAWDISFATYDPPRTWDITTPSVGSTFNVLTQDSGMQSIRFNPDGTKMYGIGSGTDTVYEYDLGTPWRLDSAVIYQSFSVATQIATPLGLHFKPDGLKMYVTDSTTDSVYEYDLATAWDVSTISYSGVVLSVSAQDTNATGIFLKPDGTKMYITGSTGDVIYEYTLSTPWNVSTATYFQSKSQSDTLPADIFFKPDGTKMFLIGSGSDSIYEYALSTAWDISTATLTISYATAATETLPTGLAFDTYGRYVYMVGSTLDIARQYILGAFDFIAAPIGESGSSGIFFKPDGTKMYMIGTGLDAVQEFSLSTPWNTSTASAPTAFYVSTQDTTPTGFHFKGDGTAFYMIGTTNDSVYSYTLSTPWDITTASAGGSYASAGNGETSPTGLFFKPDGTIMYTCGTALDEMQQYTLTTPWDITTAIHDKTSNLFAAIETACSDIFFSPDGLRLFLLGTGTDWLHQFSLSTAWDIATLSFVRSFKGLGAVNPSGVFFKSDGTKFFIVGATGDAIETYKIE